jgi:multisubunit Na+/H+ antiporter MnhB subunit
MRDSEAARAGAGRLAANRSLRRVAIWLAVGLLAASAVALSLRPDSFRSGAFMPHGYCYLWNAELVQA